MCPESTYDGQSSKNNFTRSGQHRTSYDNWVRYESGAINPKTGKRYAKPGTNSFLYDHQQEDHNGAPPNFSLKSKRFYGKDRLACQVAEAVSLKMRKGKILNSKGDFHSPPLIEIQRNIRRGIWQLWAQATTFLIIKVPFVHADIAYCILHNLTSFNEQTLTHYS